MCENGELLLEAVKLHFRKAKQQGLADDLPSEPLALVELGVCSSKNYPCIGGQCEKCPGKTAVSSLCEQLERLAHITYFCWVTEGNVVKKKQRSNWWRNGCSAGGLNDRNKNEMAHVQHITTVPKKIGKKMTWFSALTFLRTTEPRNATKCKVHILNCDEIVHYIEEVST